jgi:DNA-binding transcriptional regulator YiaG
VNATVTDIARWRDRRHSLTAPEDLPGLVRTARQRLGLNREDFAAALSGQLGRTVRPGHVKAWEEGAARVLRDAAEACREILAGSIRPASQASRPVAAGAAASGSTTGLLAEPDPHSASSLWESATAIARMPNGSALETFSASHRIRGYALKLAGQTSFPLTRADLHVIAGEMAALMASTAFDLNRWDESATFAQSAVSCADQARNTSLKAWTLGLCALLANWRNAPDIALGHFRRALPLAPRGTPRARLRFIAARSYALAGDGASVRRVLDLARRDQDDALRHTDLLSEEIGGEFAFGHARADACAAAAWLDLGDAAEAAAAARRALSSLTALPPGGRPISQAIGVQIDLATACLLGGHRDEAEDALGQVFAAPSTLRNVSLSGRFVRARAALASPHWAKDLAARQMDNALVEWLAPGL